MTQKYMQFSMHLPMY